MSFIVGRRKLVVTEKAKHQKWWFVSLLAIELDPTDAIAYNGRGGAYGSLKKYPEAIADFTKAIKLDPTDAIAYNNRGIAYKALGKTIEAEADFAKAKSLKN